MSTPDPQPPMFPSPDPIEAEILHALDAMGEVTKVVAPYFAAAYRRGLLRAAEIAEAEECSERSDYGAGIDISAKRIARAIRSEADTPGTA